MLPCFLDGLASRLFSRMSEGAGQPGTGLARVDDVVDIPPRRGDVGMREALAVFLHSLPERGFRVVGPRDLLAEEDLDGALGAP